MEEQEEGERRRNMRKRLGVRGEGKHKKQRTA